MLEFQPLTLGELPRLRDFFKYSGGRICDTTPGTVFMWRDMYRTEYAVYDGSLYFKVDYPGLGPTFPLPLGGGRPEHFRRIAEYCCRQQLPISFCPVPREELDRLQDFFPNSAATANRDSFDYLYRAEDLQFFRGKKLSGPRNHVNKFLKTYGNWTFGDLTEDQVPEVLAFLDRYAAGWDKAAPSFHEEVSKNREVLEHLSAYDMKGGVLGFSLGEIVGDTLFTHIEKADRDYEGCYQMLVAQFAQRFAGGTAAFINREDDAGDLGLRASKLRYQPVALLEKFIVTIEEPCGAHG